MTEALEIFAVLCIAFTVFSVGVSLTLASAGRDGYEVAIIESRYIRRIYDTLIRPRPSGEPVMLPRSGRRRARRTLGRLLARASDRILFADRKGVAILAARTGTDDYLSAYFPPGSRARRYSAAARIPVYGKSLHRLRRAAGFGSGTASIAALTAAAVNAPSDPLKAIAPAGRRIPVRALLEMRDLLLRRGTRIDYESCLSSGSPDLVIMGLTIVGDFRISGAEEQVLAALSSPDAGVVRTAILTLALLRSPLSDTRIRESLARMPASERLSHYRLFVREGYSLSSLRPVLIFEKSVESGLDRAVSDTVQARKRSLARKTVSE